jgi:hypothetical protein
MNKVIAAVLFAAGATLAQHYSGATRENPHLTNVFAEPAAYDKFNKER